jgi:hypothetical protein
VALRELDKYRGNAMWVPEKQKVFYSGITDALREYIADKTAEAVANAIVERINEAVDATVYKTIYNSVYKAMKGNEGYMDGILEEMIPGYGQLSGLLGGFGQ